MKRFETEFEVDKINRKTIFFNTGIDGNETFDFKEDDNIGICSKCVFANNYLQVAPCLDCQSNSMIEETKRQYFKEY